MITGLTVEYVKEPAGTPRSGLRFGWRAENAGRDWKQKSCRIAVASCAELLSRPDIWDSGEIKTGRSDHIPYGGPALKSGTEYAFRVSATGGDGGTACADSLFETGLCHDDFTAQWIAQPAARPGWASCFRHEFVLGGQPVSARAYISAMGAGELYINGEKVGDRIFEPAQTCYNQTVPYTVYNIDALLKTGENALGVLLGDGWFNQSRVWSNGGMSYGEPRLLLEIHIRFADGTTEKILSGDHFLCDYSPVTLNNVYGGETYDARLEQPGWNAAGFDGGWKNAVTVTAPKGRLTCLLMPPVRKYRRVAPVSVRTLHPGSGENVFIYDMGENFAGFVRMRIPPSAAGSEYVLRFAEEADENGGLNYRSTGDFATRVTQQDRYIAKGDPAGEVWEPRFTYHGFRYVEMTGLYKAWENDCPEEDGLSLQAVLEGWAVNTDLISAGAFSCGNETVNAIEKLTARTFLSNYHGFPEDCPVREKCGWLGDAQLMCEAGIYRFDMAASYEKYMADIADSKEEFGNWMMIAPGKRVCHRATPLWSSAQAVIPWALYLYYGNETVLKRCYPLMAELAKAYEAESINGILHFGLGDWCPPGGNVQNPRRIPVETSSTAEFYTVAGIVSKTAKILGKTEDARRFAAMADKVKEAFNRQYYDAAHHSYGTQGANGAALYLELCPGEDRPAVALDTLRLLEENNGGMATGIWGTKKLVPAMTEMGYGAEMLKMLLNPGKTSFATMLAGGATSLWENLSKSDGLGSLNHPMQGAFTSWFYSHILGIRPMESAPGFKEFLLEPWAFSGINGAKGHYDSIYGRIEVSWTLKSSSFSMEFTVPPNTLAHCSFSGVSENAVQLCRLDGKNKHTSAESNSEGEAVRLGAGSYRAKIPL